MPYHVGSKGSYGCSGYPAVKDDGTVMGCHTTRGAAARQIYAINVSEGNIGKAMVKEGDMVIAPNDDEVFIGRVVHVMTEGMLGFPGSEYALAASAEEPAVLIQIFEMEEGGLEETKYFVGFKASEVMAMPSLESNIGMDKSMYRVVQNNPGCTGGFAVLDEDGELEGCFATREEANAFAEANNREEEMDSEDDSMDMDKAKKPNYGEMIQPRRGGSEPANARLYAQILREAKDKFDVYPSAVANSWVVQEYKRRGGTYKGQDTAKAVWSGSAFDFNSLVKRDYTTEQRRRLAAEGNAMPDGSYPIANRTDLMNAIRSWGRGGADPKVKAFIIRRARALNAEDMIPENWK